MHVVLCSVIRNNKRSELVSVFRLNAFRSSSHVAQYFYWNDWITNFRSKTKTKTKSDMRSFCLFFHANYDYYCEKWYLNAVELCGWRLQERLRSFDLQMANFLFSISIEGCFVRRNESDADVVLILVFCVETFEQMQRLSWLFNANDYLQIRLSHQSVGRSCESLWLMVNVTNTQHIDQNLFLSLSQHVRCADINFFHKTQERHRIENEKTKKPKTNRKKTRGEKLIKMSSYRSFFIIKIWVKCVLVCARPGTRYCVGANAKFHWCAMMNSVDTFREDGKK